MKKFDLRGLSLVFGVVGLMLMSGVSMAQNARVQLINNSAAAVCDTIDVYLNGTKVADDLLFRNGSALLSLTPGNYLVDINGPASLDSGSQRIASFNIALDVNSGNMLMLEGVDDTSSAMHAPNPDAINTSLALVHRKGVDFTAATGQTSLSVFHGTTDFAGFSMSVRVPSAKAIATNLHFMDTTGNVTAGAVESLMDLKNASGTVVINSFILPLASYARKSLVIFTSGFVNPAANQNGPGFGVYALDTNGGAPIMLAAASRIQFIHNSPDPENDTLGIWLYNTVTHDSVVLKDMVFRTAGAMQTIREGVYDIVLTKAHRTDTAAAGVLFRANAQSVSGGKTYLAMVAGLADTMNYAVNPNGVRRNLSLDLYDNFSEGVATGVTVFFANGVPDAPALTIDRNIQAPVNIFPASDFRNMLTMTNLDTGKNYVIIEKNSTGINKVARLRLPAIASQKTGVLFASGFYDTTGNANIGTGRRHSYFLASPNGTITAVPTLNGFIQFINASADKVKAGKVSLFINGVKAYDTFPFRKATPFMSLAPLKSYRLNVAPANSVDTSTSYYGVTITPDTMKYYYAVATGMVDAGFAANPDGVSTAFEVLVYANAKTTAAQNSKNVDLLYFHAMSDVQATVIKGKDQTQFLSNNNKFKTFNANYRAHAGLDNIQFDVRDAANDTFVLFTGYGNLALYKGTAGLVFASGFLHPSANKGGDSVLMMVAWPTGKTDTIGPKKKTGIKEELIPANSVSCYPNPAQSLLNIDFEAHRNGTLDLQLIDITGRAVIKRSMNVTHGKNEIEINVSQIPAGLYFIQLGTGQGAVVKKAVISR